jgi:SNF2 family DNA or RNA helicase
MTAYKSKYFRPVGFMGYGFEILPGAKEEIMTKISDITMTLDVEDLLEMPDRVDLKEMIELSPADMKRYKALEKDFFHQLESDDGIEVLSAVALSNKLAQFASGRIYDTDKTPHFVHDEKIKRLRELREAHPSENMLVAYNFQFERDALLEAFPEAVLLDTKGEAIDAWNEGKIPMLVANPQSASMGLNLQKGGSVIVWYGLTWNLTNYLQFNGRVYRQGQKRHVRIVHLLVKDTMDEKIFTAIEAKAQTQSDLLSHMKLFNGEF